MFYLGSRYRTGSQVGHRCVSLCLDLNSLNDSYTTVGGALVCVYKMFVCESVRLRE